MLSLVNSTIFRSYLQTGRDFRRASYIPISLCKASKLDFLKTQAKVSCGTGEKGGGSGGGGGGGGGKHSVQYKPYVAPCYRDHDHKNMGLNRPMSPHLTIYAPTMPAMTSITQRITGVILTFYAFAISCGILFLSNGVESIVSMIQSLDFSRPMLFILKLILGFPFAYHYFFGIRFVAWNAGRWLTMKDVQMTYKKMLIATAVCNLLFCLF